MQPRLLRSTLVGLYVLAAICAARALPITVPEAPVQIDAAEAGGRHEADIIGSANGANRISAVPAGFTGGGDLSALGTSDPDAATAILKTGRGGIKEPNKAAAGTDQQPGNTALLASKGEQQTAAFGIRVYSAKEVETLGISNMPGASEYYLSARGPRDGTIFKVPLWLRPGFDRTVYIPLDGQAPDVASYVRFFPRQPYASNGPVLNKLFEVPAGKSLTELALKYKVISVKPRTIYGAGVPPEEDTASSPVAPDLADKVGPTRSGRRKYKPLDADGEAIQVTAAVPAPLLDPAATSQREPAAAQDPTVKQASIAGPSRSRFVKPTLRNHLKAVLMEPDFLVDDSTIIR